MNKKEILQEIEDNSPHNQVDALKAFLFICEKSSQWQAFTVCQHKKTGPLSYQSVRVWSFSNTKMFNLVASNIE